MTSIITLVNAQENKDCFIDILKVCEFVEDSGYGNGLVREQENSDELGYGVVTSKCVVEFREKVFITISNKARKDGVLYSVQRQDVEIQADLVNIVSDNSGRVYLQCPSLKLELNASIDLNEILFEHGLELH